MTENCATLQLKKEKTKSQQFKQHWMLCIVLAVFFGSLAFGLEIAFGTLPFILGAVFDFISHGLGVLGVISLIGYMISD